MDLEFIFLMAATASLIGSIFGAIIFRTTIQVMNWTNQGLSGFSTDKDAMRRIERDSREYQRRCQIVRSGLLLSSGLVCIVFPPWFVVFLCFVYGTAVYLYRWNRTVLKARLIIGLWISTLVHKPA